MAETNFTEKTQVNLTEKTQVKLTISSWYHVMVIVGVIVAIYFGLRQDVTTAISTSAKNAEDLRTAQQSIMDMRLDVQRINDNITWFRQQYEQDMKRYVRETPTR
jgi:prefoldin subunit 5